MDEKAQWFVCRAYDGTEVCELVGMLFFISKRYNKKGFGLYRDDGLGVVKNRSGPEL